MSRKTESSWVDRGESAIPKLRHALVHFFERFDEAAGPFLDEHATIVFGMVAADATDVQIAMYLRGVVRDVGFPNREPLGSRVFAISMWHIAKVALVRDAAERRLRQQAVANEQTTATLGNWLAERLMTPDELLAYQQRIEALTDHAAAGEKNSAYAD
ncbi:MAG: hypothetical protein ABI120_16230 [Gemmatimonadaceae bacterium]